MIFFISVLSMMNRWCGMVGTSNFFMLQLAIINFKREAISFPLFLYHSCWFALFCYLIGTNMLSASSCGFWCEWIRIWSWQQWRLHHQATNWICYGSSIYLMNCFSSSLSSEVGEGECSKVFIRKPLQTWKLIGNLFLFHLN